MNYPEARREAAQRLVLFAAAQGVDLTQFRDEYDVFDNRNRHIDIWLEGDSIGYHLRGEIRTLPTRFAGSQSSFRGVWDEAGSITGLHQALDLLRSWLIDGKEIDELTERKIHRAMM